MLTKVVLLLARKADEAEWVFEMKAMDDKASGNATRGNAFLFIYTVTRYYIGVSRAHADAASEAYVVSGLTPFLANLRDAVASHASQHALVLWTTSPFGLESDVAAPTIQRLAFELLRQLSIPAADLVASSVADCLPYPYRPDAAAGHE